MSISNPGAASANASVNVAQIGGTAQTGVDLSAKWVKRARTAIAPTSVTVGAASANAIAARTDRRGLYLRVTDAADRISLGWGAQAAVLDSGITVESKEVYIEDALTGISEEAIQGISNAAGTTVAVQESL